jgi:hypothetical protein
VAEKQISDGFFSRAQSLEPRETMRTMAKGCGEGWGGVRCLLWGCGFEVRGKGGRAATVGECGFNGFCYKVKKEAEEGESIGHCLMRGSRGGTDGASLTLSWSTGGRPMMARGAVVPARPKAARATEVGDKQGSGPSGRRRPVGQLGWSGPRRPGGPRWAGTE